MQKRIVEHDRLTVEREPDVQLNQVCTARGRDPDCGARIFHRSWCQRTVRYNQRPSHHAFSVDSMPGGGLLMCVQFTG